jgi:hypothetical protein
MIETAEAMSNLEAIARSHAGYGYRPNTPELPESHATT